MNKGVVSLAAGSFLVSLLSVSVLFPHHGWPLDAAADSSAVVPADSSVLLHDSAYRSLELSDSVAQLPAVEEASAVRDARSSSDASSEANTPEPLVQEDAPPVDREHFGKILAEVKPAAAAAMMEYMDDETAASLLFQLPSPRSAAAILSKLPKERAARLSLLMLASAELAADSAQ